MAKERRSKAAVDILGNFVVAPKPHTQFHCIEPVGMRADQRATQPEHTGRRHSIQDGTGVRVEARCSDDLKLFHQGAVSLTGRPCILHCGLGLIYPLAYVLVIWTGVPLNIATLDCDFGLAV